MTLKDKAAVTGVGETAYVRGTPKSSIALQFEASLKAVADAGLKPQDIDGIISMGISGAPAEEFINNFGLRDLRFSALIPHGGASGIAALQTAAARRYGSGCGCNWTSSPTQQETPVPVFQPA